MTFTWYGLTSFEVQYWDGSSWVSVPGGSVTGNNKVWRKFSFSPITTTKLRVLTSASPDSWSRINEIEAWQVAGSGNSGADIHWLVADQLGIPRMIADRTGSLAGVSRHDYLPFGEEIGVDVGGRTLEQGYSLSDDVRQRFTAKEHDDETGLDYFGARHYASRQGRFTSADPLYLELRRLRDPQLLNLYAYTRNNPLKFVDPDGLDVKVSGDAQEDYRRRLQQKTPSFQLSINKKGMVAIVDAKGKELGKKALEKLGKALTGGEKELFNAITDKKNHVTINTLRTADANVDFGRFDGRGTQTLDFTDLNLLDSPKNAGGLSSAQVVAHETLEGYEAAKTGATMSNAPHNYANQFFGGLDDPIASTIQTTIVNGAYTEVSFEMPVHGSPGVNLRITRQFLTPIPVNAVPSRHIPAHIVNAEKKP